MPQYYNYNITKLHEPKTHKELHKGTTKPFSQNNTSQLYAGTHESPNAPRLSLYLDLRNLREVEREYNDSVNGHPRA